MPEITHLNRPIKDIIIYLENKKIDASKSGIGYYMKGAPSQWMGSGAEALGFKGKVKSEDFARVLSGKFDDIDVSKRGETHKHPTRHGTDLTFKAPKSYSIMALAGGDRRLIDGHDEAVREAMAFIEKECVIARYGKGGMTKKNTNFMVAAAYRHNDTRAVDDVADPLVHTHAIIANLTKREDGTYSRMKLDFGEKAKLLKMAGEIYYAKLAKSAHELGYEVERKGDAFEIVGFTAAQLKGFSRRSQQIADKLEEEGFSREGGPNRKKAWKAIKDRASLATRRDKTQLNEYEQRAEWRTRARNLGIDFEKIKAEAEENRKNPNILTTEQRADSAISSAVRHLSERQTLFSANDIKIFALGVGCGKVDKKDVDAALARAEKTSLIRIRNHLPEINRMNAAEAEIEAAEMRAEADRNGVKAPAEKPEQKPEDVAPSPIFGVDEDAIKPVDRPVETIPEPSDEEEIMGQDLYTTELAVSQEAEVIARASFGRNKAERLGNGEKIVRAAEKKQGFKFTEGQAEAIKLAADTHDRIIVFRGAAGAGKTTSMKAVVDLYRDHKYEIEGVAPSTAAAKELQSAGCETKTLAKSIREEVDTSGKPKLYVLDEAGMVSTKDMVALLAKADAENARVILVGDPRQLTSVEAGTPLEYLIKSKKVRVAEIDEIQRQKNENLKEVVQKFADGDADTGVTLAGDFMHESDNPTEDAVLRWKGMTPVERENTMIITGRNVTKTAINERVRKALKETGELGQEDVEFTALEKSSLTAEQLKSAHSYKAGMVVRDTRQRLHVIKETRRGVLVFNEGDGIETEMHPRSDKIGPQSAYNTVKRKLAKGDLVIFRENTKFDDVEIHNGSRGTVLEINGVTKTAVIEVTTKKGLQTITMKQNDALVMDHRYCGTKHATQGQTIDNIIVAAEVSKAESANAAYVAISRARHMAEIFTDSKEKLQDKWRKEVKNRNARDYSPLKYDLSEIPEELMQLREQYEQRMKIDLLAREEIQRKQHQAESRAAGRESGIMMNMNMTM